MFKRSHFIALGLVVLLTLVLLNLPHHTANRIKLALGSLFLPLFGLSKSSQQLVREAREALTPRSDLLKQIEQLQLTNRLLRLEQVQVEALRRENERLRQLVGWPTQSPWNPRLANVVARDPANWGQAIQIGLGTHDDQRMRVDLPVLDAAGCLVGRVSAVGLTRSQVELIGNRSCPVSALVRETGESGVIAGGAGPLDKTMATLSYLSSNSNLKPGQKVITSGMGGIFPKGIPIGQIAEDSRLADFGLYTEARVKLAANLGALEEVWVVTTP